MSILKRLLVEDLAPLLRKPRIETLRGRVADTLSTGQPISSKSEGTSKSGMTVVILNWKSGENDPFSVVNSTIQKHLRACGKNVEIIEIATNDWPARLAAIEPNIEFAITWQGLGSYVMVGDDGESLWDHLRIPLICIHGDHPSHMPMNHQLESRYCFHLYANAEFARYSNRHFRRVRGAGMIDIPQLHREPRLGRREGDYFVFAKNIDDPIDTEKSWRQRLDTRVFQTYMMAAEALTFRVARESYVEIHDLLDDLIVQHGLEWLTPQSNVTEYHQYHSQLDRYMRSYKSVTAVTALDEFPIRIYGRGWDRIALSAPAAHCFAPGRNMAESQDLYYTRYGLIDVSPSKGLHDRTRRAMANGGAFLSSANLEDSFADIGRFDPLFFSFKTDELREKCAAVLREPERHLALASQFAHIYHDRFSFKDFVNRIDDLAKSVSGF